MKIAILVKQVPSADSRLILNADTFNLERTMSDPVINSADLFAVEAALRISDGTEVQTVAISMGPVGVEQSTKRALAMGVDESVHITDEQLRGADIWVTSSVLAAALSQVGADLVFAGTQSSDGQGAAVPAYVAELLGWKFVEVFSEIELDSILNLNQPVVIAVGSGFNTPRLPNFKGIAAAKNKPVSQLNLQELGLAGLSSKIKVVSQTSIASPKVCEKLDGSNSEIAKKILEKIFEWNSGESLHESEPEFEVTEQVKVFDASEINEAVKAAAKSKIGIVTNVVSAADGKFVKTNFDGATQVVLEVDGPCVITKAPSLSANGIAVGVGGGVSAIEPLRSLATNLHAELVGTAAAIDKGFISFADLVGESGRSISPNIYLNFGVSGAHHHMVGLSRAKYVVSVNKDPEAEIFAKSDVAVVADADEIIAALLQELDK